jgi:pyruvate/2-oxoglutarate dehydrogenase complex dihydrolipoamide acyltransferase (E2) component
MDVNIPRLGVAMTEGVLVEWLVGDGVAVAAGTPIYRLETDKVENEIEAPAGGTVRILAEPGETYAVGTTVARIE